jgi:hypothetical protein
MPNDASARLSFDMSCSFFERGGAMLLLPTDAREANFSLVGGADTMARVAAKIAVNAKRLAQMRALRDAICVASPQPVDRATIAQRPIAFNDAMVRAILAGRKTQTRRLLTSRDSCRFGQPGDRLWVRQRWARNGDGHFLYSSDGVLSNKKIAWRASYHMPRHAGRILLRITAVRAERLRRISAADARAEGFDGPPSADAVQWFRELWDSINTSPGTRWADNPWVWVIEFAVHTSTASTPA